MTDLFQYHNDSSESHSYLLDRTDYIKNVARQYTKDNENESQLVFDMIQLSNNNNIIDWSQSYLDLPFTITLESAHLDATKNSYACTIKGGIQNMINSCLINYANNNVNQLNNYANFAMNWELLKMDENKLKTLASQMLFSLDGVNTTFHSKNNATPPIFVLNKNGIGECNNITSNNVFIDTLTGLTGATPPVNITLPILQKNGTSAGKSYTTNEGFVQRCDYINNKETEFISLDNLANTASNYIYTETNKIVYYMRGILPLSIMHDFFRELGTVMGANVKIELTLNTGKCVITTEGGLYKTYNPIFSRNNTCPFMLAPLDESGIVLSDPATTLNVSCKIGHSGVKPSGAPDPIIYTKQVRYNAEYMSSFLAKPMKTLIYHDYYTFLSNPLESGRSINNVQIITACSRARFLVIIPLTSSLNILTGTSTTLGSLSPFTSQPQTTASNALLSNFMVYKSNNSLFQQSLQYGFENYQQNLVNIMSINGGNIKSPLTSGLITKNMFDKNYCYYAVNLSEGRKSDIDDSVSHSYSVEFTNNSKLTLQYMFLIYFERNLSINKSTGDIIM
jgi:hypothetical protein